MPPELRFELAWQASLAACATAARGVVDEAHAALVGAWLAEGPQLADAACVESSSRVRYLGRAPDGAAIISYTLMPDERAGVSDYRQRLAFRKERIARCGQDPWPQILEDLQARLQNASEAIRACIGGYWTPPLKIEGGRALFHRGFCDPDSRRPPDFDREMRRWQQRGDDVIPSFAELTEAPAARFEELGNVCQDLGVQVSCLDELERLCVHLILQRVAAREEKERKQKLCCSEPGFRQLQHTGSASEGYTLRIGRRTRAATVLDEDVRVQRLADLALWVGYREARDAENQLAMDALLAAAPPALRNLEGDELLARAMRWSLLRRADMDDVGLWIRYRNLPTEQPAVVQPLDWADAQRCQLQVKIATAITASHRRCLLGGPIALDLEQHFEAKPLYKHGVSIHAPYGPEGKLIVRAASLVWPSKVIEASGYALGALWDAISQVQRERHDEVRRLWKRSLLVGKLWVPAGWEGHQFIGVSAMSGKLRPLIKDDGSLWISAWRGHHNDGFYYREYPVQSFRCWQTLREARAWTCGSGEVLPEEKIEPCGLSHFDHDADSSRVMWFQEIPELEPQHNPRYES